MAKKVINLSENKPIIKNEDGKYSTLLSQLLTPFIKDFEHIEYYEDMFNFVINAWNVANMKDVLPAPAFKDLLSHGPKEDLVLMRKIVNYKIKNFKEHTNFIFDYEVEKLSTEIVIRVVTQKKEDYLNSMINDVENKNSKDANQNNFINRSSIIIKQLQPFIDWHNSVYSESPLNLENTKEPNTYLISEDVEDIERLIL